MSKAALALFCNGIIFLFISLLISAFGVPDENELVMNTGKTVMNALNETANSPEVSKITSDYNDMYKSAMFFFGIIGVLEIVVSFVIFLGPMVKEGISFYGDSPGL